MLIAVRKYVASLTISLARLRTLAKRMPEGPRRKTKINEQRWIAVMPCQQYHIFHYRGRRCLRVSAVPKERGGGENLFFFLCASLSPNKLRRADKTFHLLGDIATVTGLHGAICRPPKRPLVEPKGRNGEGCWKREKKKFTSSLWWLEGNTSGASASSGMSGKPDTLNRSKPPLLNNWYFLIKCGSLEIMNSLWHALSNSTASAPRDSFLGRFFPLFFLLFFLLAQILKV